MFYQWTAFSVLLLKNLFWHPEHKHKKRRTQRTWMSCHARKNKQVAEIWFTGTASECLTEKCLKKFQDYHSNNAFNYYVISLTDFSTGLCLITCKATVRGHLDAKLQAMNRSKHQGDQILQRISNLVKMGFESVWLKNYPVIALTLLLLFPFPLLLLLILLNNYIYYYYSIIIIILLFIIITAITT